MGPLKLCFEGVVVLVFGGSYIMKYGGSSTSFSQTTAMVGIGTTWKNKLQDENKAVASEITS